LGEASHAGASDGVLGAQRWGRRIAPGYENGRNRDQYVSGHRLLPAFINNGMILLVSKSATTLLRRFIGVLSTENSESREESAVSGAMLFQRRLRAAAGYSYREHFNR
jgi:hypothetical protein